MYIGCTMTHAEALAASKNNSLVRFTHTIQGKKLDPKKDRDTWYFLNRPDSDPSAHIVRVFNSDDSDWCCDADYRNLEVVKA